MLPGMELMGCTNLAVPAEVMHHIVRVESSYNPFAIGVVGGRLARQPRNLPEAVATAQMLESRGYNFSLGLAQVNRYNLKKYGLDSYERAFGKCANLTAGASILAECHSRSKGDWGNAFSCYYSGNFVTGYRHGYVQRVFASMSSARAPEGAAAQPIDVLAQSRGPQAAVASTTRSRQNPLVALRSGNATSSRAEPLSRAELMPVSGAIAAAGSAIPSPAAAPVLPAADVRPGAAPSAEAVRAAAASASAVPSAAQDNGQSNAATDSAFVF